MRPLTIGPNGSLYGATLGGGEGTCNYYGDTGCGTVFNVTPSPTFPRTPLQPWLERVLYRFAGGSDGGIGIAFTTLLFDHAENMYGTTCWSICTQNYGGEYGYGAVFKLTPSGNNWAESVIYSFAGGTDGANPLDGVISDSAGSLYGTTANGGGSSVCVGGCGTIFELSPSGSGWTEKILYSFQGGSDGMNPYSGVVMDAAGNLYGNTFQGGLYSGGTVYQLTQSSGNWSLTTLTSGNWYAIGRLAIDSAGNLYEATTEGGIGNNSTVFELTPSNGNWIYTLLHDFAEDDGIGARGGVVLDSSGNIYGTVYQQGLYGYGDVWEITP